VYSIGQDMQLNLADRHLAELGLERRIELIIESFLLVPLLVRGTSLVSLVLERSAALRGCVLTHLHWTPIRRTGILWSASYTSYR